MGEWMQPVPVKMGSETRAQLDALQEGFAPLAPNRSQVVRASIEIAHRMVFGGTNVPQVRTVGQGLQRSFVYHAVALLADFANHLPSQEGRERQLAIRDDTGNKPFPPQRAHRVQTGKVGAA